MIRATDQSLIAAALLGATCLCTGAAATVGGPVQVTLTATSTTEQSVEILTPVPVPFAVIASDPGGTPLAGLTVSFAVDFCIDAPLLPPTCPPSALYGSFDDQSNATAVTDARGIAVAPTFVAGSLNGRYDVYSGLDYQTVGGVDYIHALSPFPLFYVSQEGGTAAVASQVPTLNGPLGLVAIVLLGALGAKRRRERNQERVADPDHVPSK